MHYVSLIVEFLRGRPRLVFWSVTLSQAGLWFLLPSLFYSAPPGDVATVLAIGHEMQLGSYLGPPLAFWLGDIAFRMGGSVGVYFLAQVCIVATFWAVFTLGRAIVGISHAVLAVLLMVGISAFNVPSPDFGPAILAAPLWAYALLLFWRALGQGQRAYWFALGVILGLLLLTSYVGLILVGLMVVFVLVAPQGRDALRHPEPGVALVLMLVVVFPHLVWLVQGQGLALIGLRKAAVFNARLPPDWWLMAALVLTHLGLILVAVLASGWPRWRGKSAPEIDRQPVSHLARGFVFYFALLPAVAAIAIVRSTAWLGPLDRLAPLVVLSGLAAVLAAGDRILLFREWLVSSAWIALLLAPPILVMLGIAVLPWTFGIDLKVGQPANAEGRFFADTYQRRTGKPLEYVTGDPVIAPLIALGAPSRPHVYFDWAPARSPWATPADIRRHGGILVWPVAGNAVAPPVTLATQFPEMVPEVPQDFPRHVQGMLSANRLGWAMMRPEAETPGK
jgi:4-amino-4-deoxy-L-arabinose transferase-like glycosyltransferase